MIVMRGYGQGDLVFFFRGGVAIGLDLYREWEPKNHKLHPGEEVEHREADALETSSCSDCGKPVIRAKKKGLTGAFTIGGTVHKMSAPNRCDECYMKYLEQWKRDHPL